MEITTDSISFEDIRKNNFLYIDKTAFIEKLINHNNRLFFLQRPRRFGKSLILSTMLSIFNGEAELFKGLALNSSNYEFIKYPILNFNFSNLKWKSVRLLELDIYERICIMAQNKFDLSVKSETKSISTSLSLLVDKIKEKTDKKVVILVDEYDGPIIKALKKPKAAMKNAETLSEFFDTIKDLNQNKYIHFAFVTGVSKFSMTSIFSGANVFTDISENIDYANICGITIDEFNNQLKAPIMEMFENKPFNVMEFKDGGAFIEALTDMYDGYSWNGDDRIFNPFSLLNAITNHELKAYWFKSGTPTFLNKFVRSEPENAVNLEQIEMTENELDNQTADDLSFVPLLYQTGYLTLARPLENNTYTLKIPNIEVRNALYDLITKALVGKKLGNYKTFGKKIIFSFRENNMEELQHNLTELINQLQLFPSELGERAFHVFILTFLIAAEVKKIYSELPIEGGRVDICFILDDRKAFLLELKAFHPKPHTIPTKLEDEFTENLNKAVEQLEKYYNPLFDKIPVDEIQGIALAIGWSYGVRAKLGKTVMRNQ
ncbi:MAG: AAA family ATPase [Deltaproteobacteria bacterium]|nr:AAA family ATPase [Deltaproteobacteria bacterium]